MAIRMKEWGMLAAPGQPVRVPTQGLTGWLGAARSLGNGLASVVRSGAELYAVQHEQREREREEARERVERTGELAAFSERLRGIASELREELQEEPVQDWEYAWEAAAAPRLAEAVEELPASTRASGLALARAYSAHASIEARRDVELQRVEVSRSQWQQRVEDAVAAGEEEQAARWLECGRGVFVSEEELPARQQEVRRRAQRQAWERRLMSEPLEALAELAEEAERRAEAQGKEPVEDAEGAEGAEGAEEGRSVELEAVEQGAARVRRRLQQELAQQWSQAVLQGEEPDASALALARRAGLLPRYGVSAAGSGALPAPAAAPLSAQSLSAWRCWVDERAEGEEAEAASRLALAAAPLPLEERRRLLQRLERTAQVSAADRRSMSRSLVSLFRSGAFGCPGDELAQRELLDLQEEAASLLAAQGAEGAAAWLDARRGRADNWICFNS